MLDAMSVSAKPSTVPTPASPRYLIVMVALALALALASALALSGCGGDSQPEAEDPPRTPHLLAPTEQMRDLAERQCLDDPTLEQGEINAVDPENPDNLLAQVIVECDEVRDGHRQRG